MQKQQILGLIALLAMTAVVACGARPWLVERADTLAAKVAYEELLANTPVAELEGEAVSPNGWLEVQTVGKSDLYISGVVVPEAIRVVDRKSGEIKWEDQGYFWQSASWSPGNNLVALAYGGRTWTAVKVISTAYWTSWDFVLPDGSSIPEYTFLPEDWGTWLDTDTLLLTVGRGGDAGEQHIYRCSVHAGEEKTTGSTLEQTTAALPGNYDFDHNGEPETVELVTVLTPETSYFPAWYELRVKRPDGGLLWSQEAGLYHVGWVSLFACKIDDADFLLRYTPWSGQGYQAYDYQIFSLDSAGEETVLKANRVEFDMRFESEMHQSFDPAAIAAFLEEVHGYLDDSTLLITTEGGDFRTGESGADFRDDMDFWGGDCPYDESVSLEENLQNYGIYLKNLSKAV
jgi:hypothetical protein